MSSQIKLVSNNQVDQTHNGDGKSNIVYEKLADALLANPRLSGRELSKMFGYTPTWISIIIGSDAFRAMLQRRKETVVDPMLRATVEDHYRALATKSCQVLLEKLSHPADCISDDLALKAAKLGADMFKPTPTVPQAPESSIDRLADRLIALQSNLRGTILRSSEVIDVPVS